MANTSIKIFLVLFLVAWSAAVLIVLDYKSFAMLARDRAAAIHPTAAAVITRSAVESDSNDASAGRGGITYTRPFKVTYRYQVAGREYSGDRFHHGMHAGGIKAARKIQSRYPVGSRVEVHYNPLDPNDSVMTTGLRGDDLLMLLAMTPFNVVMLFGWYIVGMAACFPDTPLTRLSDQSAEVRLRLQSLPPVGVFLIALGAASFGVLIVGMALSATIDLAGATILCAVAPTLATVLAIRWAGKLRAGDRDFIIDRLRGQLTLPLTFRKKAPDKWASTGGTGRVALSNIVDIRVGAWQGKDSDGDPNRYYQPMVIHVDDYGAKSILEIRTKTTQEHAEMIVQCLRRELGLERNPRSPS